jgi:serine protease Do
MKKIALLFLILLSVWLVAAPAAFAQGGESPGSFAALAKRAAPAVVNIYVVQAASDGMGHQRIRQGQGSGFIVDPDGYIVTNNHVVASAQQIKVRLLDQRVFDATVVGFDRQTDIALIKIKARNLPFLHFGDSDDLQVGDWVIAIGNPLGLGHTVTAGIVSAKGRVLGAGPYDDFIQTDASINPGNSGGPLIDMHGEVVGMNTMMAEAQGIGFAIPSNMVRVIIDQLRRRGHVERSWLGAYTQPITQELADTFGLSSPRGALISQVVPGSPDDHGGLRAGDVVVEFNGRLVEAAEDLPAMVAQTPAGEEVALKVVRSRQTITLHIKLEAMPDNTTRLAPRTGAEGRPESGAGGLGIELTDITSELARQLGVQPNAGVLVTSVNPDGQADRAGLARGDIILSVNQQPVHSADEFYSRIQQMPEGTRLVLLVQRGSQTFWVSMAR